MSDYPQYPSDQGGTPGANPYGESAAATSVKPSSVDMAVKLIWANIALGLVSAVITFAMLDTIIAQQLDAAGLSDQQVNVDAARGAAIIGVVIGLAIGVGLYALVAVFISKGANWARIVFTVLAALSVISALFGFGSQPLLLIVLSLVSLVLTIVTVVLLYRGDSNAYFKAR